VLLDRCRRLDHGFEARGLGHGDPLVQELGRVRVVALVVEVLESELQAIGFGRQQVGILQRIQPLLLVGREVRGVLEPDVPGLLQLGPFLGLLPPDCINSLAEDLHDMKPVEGEMGIGEVLSKAQDVGRGHVQAGLLDLVGIPAVSLEVGLEGLQGLAPFAWHGEQEFLLQHVHHQGDVVMAPPPGGLVEADLLHLGHVHLGKTLVHEVMEHAPEHRVMLPEKPGGGVHGHGWDDHHRQGFEHEREPRSGASPGHVDLLDAVLVALAPRHPRRQVGGMLKEIHVPPHPLHGVVGLTRLAAVGAWEVRTRGEVDEDVQSVALRIELEVLDLPRGLKAERHGE